LRRRRTSSIPHIYARRNENKWPDQWPMSFFLFYHKMVLTKRNLPGFVKSIENRNRWTTYNSSLQNSLAVIHWHSRGKMQILRESLGYKIQWNFTNHYEVSKRRTIRFSKGITIKLNEHITHRMAVTYDWERKGRNCVTQITLSCLCFMLGTHHFIFEGVIGQMQNKFPANLLQNK